MSHELTAPITECPDCLSGTVSAHPADVGRTGAHPGYYLQCTACGWNGQITKERFEQLVYEGTIFHQLESLGNQLRDLFRTIEDATIGRIRQ